jgi:serine protease Do
VLRHVFIRTSRPAAALTLALASALCLQANAATPVPTSGKPAAKPTAKSAAAAPASTAPAADKTQAAAQSAMATPDFFALAERYSPAVVHVIARGADDQTAQPEQEAIDDADPFFAFFRRTPRPPSESQAANAPRVMTGAGSGFIISPDGAVLTTAHVVDNAEEVVVRLPDKREFKAEVVAVDPQSDVAVLQIDGHDLPFVKLGEASKVHVGEPVLSIGSPDSFQNTVTTGIVSATSRTLPDGKSFPFLQTDVAVNPDNSGGPIFNRAGEVIGIDVQIYADGERYQGLTFAIPIDAASRFRAQLQATRKGAPAGAADAANAASAGSPSTIRTFGMQVEDVSAGLAAALGLPHAGGALVDAVDAGSPVGAAGVRAGDVIVQVGNKPVDRAATLAAELSAVPPATRTTLKLIRNRRPTLAGFSNEATPKAAAAKQVAQVAQVTQPAEATDAPDPTVAAADPPDPKDARTVKTVMTDSDAPPAAAPALAPHHAADRLGLVTHELSEDEKRSTGLPLGLMVDASSGPAATAGVRAGDVVLSLNDTLIESHEQAIALEAKAKKSVSLLIQRDNARSFVAVKLR